MMYLGDYPTSAIVRFMWNTNAVAGESITRGTNGSIRIYKNNSTTERSSANGITDTEDFDSLTGVHHCNIDLSDNTDSGFYAAGNEYMVVLQGAAIDGKTINAALAQFSVERSGGILALLKDGTNGLTAIKNAINTVDDFVDTEVAAIKTQTDKLTFDGSNNIAANVLRISDDSVAADNAESYFDGTGYGEILQRTTIATLASQTSFTLTAGSADNNAYNGAVAVIQDSATAAQKSVGVISAYTGSTKTVTLLNDPAIFTIAVGDTITILANKTLKPTVDNRTLDVSSGGEAGLDWGNIGNPTTTQGLSGTTVKTATDVETDTQDIQSRLPAALVAGRMSSDAVAISGSTAAADAVESNIGNLDAPVSTVDTVVDAIKAKTDNLPSDPADQSLVIAATTAIYDRVGAPAGASVSADIAAVKTQTAAIETDTQDVQSRLPASLDSGRIVAKAEVVADKTNYALTSGERDSIAAALFDAANAIETGLTFRQAMRLVSAVLAGKLSGAEGTMITIRNAVADDADRLIVTVTADGNRTAFTYDLS